MQLRNLLSEEPEQFLLGMKADGKQEVLSLAYDSRRVKPGSLFFAIKGLVTDGHKYIDQAISNGAVAVASENSPRNDLVDCWIQVRSVRRFMAACADRFFDYPSKSMHMIGVTGTNGKTTTAYLINSVLATSRKSAMLGSIDTRIHNEQFESSLTTPESIDIQETLSLAREKGCQNGVMEVSSHALAFDRAYSCRFPITVFTNLSQDHLDFHKDLEDYFQAKKNLFSRNYNPGLEWAVLNIDDPFGKRLSTESRSVPVTFGFSRTARIRPIRWKTSSEGTSAQLSFFGRSLGIESPLIGKHNLYNIMGAITACSLAGLSDSEIRTGVAKLSAVPGRFEKVHCDTPFTVIIDFAHTPDALNNVLALARQVTDSRVITVFGCGGDRDRAKRPLMGAIATSQSDLAIITSDNPRSEDPEKIISDIAAGIDETACQHEFITDRRKAISRALELAEPGDLVLLAGKGHETYQEVPGGKIDFDERKIVEEVLCIQ